MSHCIIDSFQQAIYETYQTKPSIVADGKIHRYGKSKKLWYALHLDGIPAGTFGDWTTGEKHTWCDKESKSNLTPEERKAIAEQAKIQKAKAEAEKRQQQQEAAQQARTLWRSAVTAAPDHKYLTNKQVNPYHLRELDGVLLVPMYTANYQLVNLQRIYGNGKKRFLKGALKQGAFSVIAGEKPLCQSEHCFVVEGFATGASLAEVRSRSPVVIAFDAGNLMPVCAALVNHFPHLSIIIMADDDRLKASKEKPNTGLEKANAVNQQFPQIQVIKPNFPPDAPLNLSDFNDLVLFKRNQNTGVQA